MLIDTPTFATSGSPSESITQMFNSSPFRKESESWKRDKNSYIHKKVNVGEEFLPGQMEDILPLALRQRCTDPEWSQNASRSEDFVKNQCKMFHIMETEMKIVIW